ncbi:PHD finger protein 20b isoform X2 [Trichomycterus rosablanca]
MTKTPPDRLGITFEIGAPLEARDSLRNWYAANIEKIDYDEEKILVHYKQWSHRYDEWFDWSSPYLRAVERIQLRRQGLQESNMASGFHVNQRVLASWSDCRYYPAKIISCNKDDSYTVRFFDGVVKTVKGMKIKPSGRESSTSKPGPPNRKRESKPGVKNPKSKENSKNHHDGESDSEKEDRKVTEKCSKSQDDGVDEDQVAERVNGHAEHEEKMSNGDSKAEALENGGEKEDVTEVKELKELTEEKEDNAKALENGICQNEGEKPVKELEKETNLGQNRRARGKLAEDAERPSVPELRKRRGSLSQTPSSKRRRANTTDKNIRAQIRPAPPNSLPDNLINKDGLSQPSHPETRPNGQTASSPDLATLLQRQAHLPTTNKYSREPLYRVIKNQPPPILSIELDHNPFKCQVSGCTKSFRKASLLHYHMKYYHSKCELGPAHNAHTYTAERQVQDTHTHSNSPRGRRTISLSLDSSSLLSDSKSSHTPSPPATNGSHRQRSSSQCERSKENLHANRALHDDRDWVAMETERKKRRERRQRDFCIKPKKNKKKKKKSKSGEDSCSDWSTDSPLWTDEESEAGLDLNTTLSEQAGETVTHESEIVRCVCEVQEENDFMIQCDECLCWQHGTCMGLYEDSVPDTYSCYICRDPPAQRQSQRYWYDKDWLSSGHMYGLSFLEENYSQQNGKKMTAAHQLLGDVHHVFEVINGLQLKMSILQAQAHPDLKLWQQPWISSDGSLRKGSGHSGVTTPSPPSPREVESTDSESVSHKQAVPTHCSFQTSYISSEHCYQKPHAYYPALEQRLVVETRSTEELLDFEAPRKLQLSNTKELECRVQLLAAEKEKSCILKVKVEEDDDPVTCDIKPDPDLLLHQQWQLNLLDHIDAVQDEVTHRMDLIERELDVLESWLDYTGELEPPDPMARLPQLKHRIRQLLTDLGTVQQIALCSSST